MKNVRFKDVETLKSYLREFNISIRTAAKVFSMSKSSLHHLLSDTSGKLWMKHSYKFNVNKDLVYASMTKEELILKIRELEKQLDKEKYKLL